tara:strand:- start:877 stop:1719 length:843 start_codon:yes stop_codon:yes gene_type:complete
VIKRVLSLGAGVQSTALLLLSVRGELPKLDCAIFSDVGWEPPEVYSHLEWLKEEAATAGIPVVTVQNGNLRSDYLEGIQPGGPRFASLPVFTLSPEGKKGMVRRMCTSEYKIIPVERYIRREILGIAPRKHAPKYLVVEQWMGISVDEASRMKNSMAKWKVHVFPFCQYPAEYDYLGKSWRRSDCVEWLQENYPDRSVPRSACVGCPYHSNEEWLRIKQDPEQWADAVEFDAKIRKQRGLEGEAFLHRSCVPLDQVDLTPDTSKGQLPLWNDECDGMCGV